MTSQQATGLTGTDKSEKKTSFINHENTLNNFIFPCGPREKQKPFVPRFSAGVAPDPITSNPQPWLGLTFASSYDDIGMQEIGRPSMDLCFVVDISGSMCWQFDHESSDSKLAVAKRAMKAIVSQLTDNDNVGIILFNTESHVLVPFTNRKNLDEAVLIEKIDSILAMGGTNLTQGFVSGMEMLDKKPSKGNQRLQTSAKRQGARKVQSKSKSKRKTPKHIATAAAAMQEVQASAGHRLRRLMFLTDMQSTQNDEDEVLSIAKKYAKKGIHTTICGIGVDLSVTTVQQLSQTPGAKYMSAASADEFEETLAAEFAYDVTPIAFDIKVTLSGTNAFHRGYGSPEVSNIKSGAKSIRLSSEFPMISSPSGNDRMAFGGIILFKLKCETDTNAFQPIVVNTTWKSMTGETMFDQQTVQFIPEMPLGVRKAAALVRYVDLQSEYVLDDRVDGLESTDEGNETAPDKQQLLERMNIHTKWVESFTMLRQWLQDELSACGDQSLLGDGGKSKKDQKKKKRQTNSSSKASNRNILDTIDQILNFENNSVNDIKGQLRTAKIVEQADAEGAAISATGNGIIDNAPNEYLCPITGCIMVDPVIAADGSTYERSAIKKWLASHSSSPATNNQLKTKTLVPNLALRKLIQEHCDKFALASKPKSGGSKKSSQTGRRRSLRLAKLLAVDER